jgi:hypothetical protein
MEAGGGSVATGGNPNTGGNRGTGGGQATGGGDGSTSGEACSSTAPVGLAAGMLIPDMQVQRCDETWVSRHELVCGHSLTQVCSYASWCPGCRGFSGLEDGYMTGNSLYDKHHDDGLEQVIILSATAAYHAAGRGGAAGGSRSTRGASAARACRDPGHRATAVRLPTRAGCRTGFPIAGSKGQTGQGSQQQRSSSCLQLRVSLGSTYGSTDKSPSRVGPRMRQPIGEQPCPDWGKAKGARIYRFGSWMANTVG